MTLVYLIASALALFGACAVFGALSVIMTLLFSPMDEYERELADREQLEQIERWRHGKEH